MVRIAIAGGSGNVALEIIDGLLATEKHDILILSRKDEAAEQVRHRVTWVRTTYQSTKQLCVALKGVHTVLSFITTQSDQNGAAQKCLIDAAISAGVKRFAPSEWVGCHFEHMPWYVGKVDIREYLKEVNRVEKVLEYCLFQPGLFTNYFAHPHKTATHFRSFQCHIDFERCRALIREFGGLADRITLTTVQDLVEVLVRAIEYDGEWPVVGGIQGCEISIGELIAIGERARDMPFQIEYLPAENLMASNVKSSWLPTVDHPGMPNAEELAAQLTASMILAISVGALNVGDQWNQLLPGHTFVQAEDFLTRVWRGKS